jgi:hypothetical protein
MLSSYHRDRAIKLKTSEGSTLKGHHKLKVKPMGSKLRFLDSSTISKNFLIKIVPSCPILEILGLWPDQNTVDHKFLVENHISAEFF